MVFYFGVRNEVKDAVSALFWQVQGWAAHRLLYESVACLFFLDIITSDML